jgi:hypothetical protein
MASSPWLFSLLAGQGPRIRKVGPGPGLKPVVSRADVMPA